MLHTGLSDFVDISASSNAVDVHFHLWHYFEMSCYKIEILRKPRLLTEQNETLLFEISSGQSYHNNATKMF